MPRWLLNRQRRFFEENSWNESTWGDDNKDTSNSDTSKNSEGKNEEGKKTPENIPYDRFKEVNDANKALKERIAEYEKKEAEAAAKQKKEEEEKAKKNGEYEKLLESKDKELSDFKAKEAIRAERENAIKAKNEERINSLKEKLWEKRKTAESLITGTDDPYALSKKLDDFEATFDFWNKRPTGWQDHWAGWNDKTSYEILKEKVEKGDRLTPEEEKAYYAELFKSK